MIQIGMSYAIIVGVLDRICTMPDMLGKPYGVSITSNHSLDIISNQLGFHAKLGIYTLSKVME